MYIYTINTDCWHDLLRHERDFLRSEYRWMRKMGYPRVNAKATIDRIASLLSLGTVP